MSITDGNQTSAERVEAPAEALLEVRELTKHYTVGGNIFGRGKKTVRAVDDVSFTIGKGETFGLVGESGCGKSTLGRSLLRLVPIEGGSIEFDGIDTAKLKGEELRQMRKQMQAVFQNPLGSLDPRMTVGATVGEPLMQFGLPRREVRARVEELFDLVGLDHAKIDAYPRHLSGGQRQRVGIARAIGLDPQLIVADEAVSALDVSVQAQIINLLVRLQRELGLSYLFISHDLAVVRHISHRVGVMYLGRIVEIADADALFSAPAHPYTRALLDSAQTPDPTQRREQIMLSGDLPSPTNVPSGCRFRTRCPLAQPICAEVEPQLREIGPGQRAACHFPLTGAAPAAIQGTDPRS